MGSVSCGDVLTELDDDMDEVDVDDNGEFN